jgi:L-lactate dehydrogenase complex protein LldF
MHSAMGGTMNNEGVRFQHDAAKAVKDDALRSAIRTATDTFSVKRTQATSSVPIEEWRNKASDIKMEVLAHLSEYVDKFSRSATKTGAIVHRARDARTAREIVHSILKDRDIKKVVKAKSMVTEEIHLNSYLEKNNIEVLETDLGEYIIQLAGEPPSHILAPAIHKNRKQVGRLFAEKLGVEYSEDPEVLTKIARKALRNEFIEAEAGISGANFAVADTGSLVLFTNEGNGRMVTTIPKLHIAVISLEKVIPSLNDLATFTRLLPRSATGQQLSSYVSIITGPRKPDEQTGAEELHIIILDNGRSEIVNGPFREILKCIRCSACMNVCPVYRVIGGHAYGSTYPGPMGIVLTNALEGIDKACHLADASTLCGACGDVCPVKVPLPRLLSEIREHRVLENKSSFIENLAMSGFGFVVKHPALYDLGQKALKLFWPVLKYIGANTILDRMPNPALASFKCQCECDKSITH